VWEQNWNPVTFLSFLGKAFDTGVCYVFADFIREGED
jgi:hypothetical protein